MNRLSPADRSRVLACLVEGNSQRATVRITGVAKGTVAKLAVELGEACERFADRVMVNLPCERIQCDEIWSFVGCKERQKKSAKMQHPGDVWTWVAIDPETKLIPRWFVGDRTAGSAYKFLRSLSPRLAKRIQLSTDGHKAYLIAVEAAWCMQPIDYCQSSRGKLFIPTPSTVQTARGAALVNLSQCIMVHHTTSRAVFAQLV